MLVVGHDAAKLLEQVEADLRLPVLDRRAKLREAVADSDRAHVMARVAQAAHDIELRAVFGSRLLADALERLRRHERFVNEDEDAKLLHADSAAACARRRIGQPVRERLDLRGAGDAGPHRSRQRRRAVVRAGELPGHGGGRLRIARA